MRRVIDFQPQHRFGYRALTRSATNADTPPQTRLRGSGLHTLIAQQSIRAWLLMDFQPQHRFGYRALTRSATNADTPPQTRLRGSGLHTLIAQQSIRAWLLMDFQPQHRFGYRALTRSATNADTPPQTRLRGSGLHTLTAQQSIRAWLLAVALLLLAPPHAHSAGLSMAQQLSELGSPQAALAIINSLQEVPKIRSSDWEYLERERINILHRWEMWQEIVKRGLNLPPQLTQNFYEWSLQHTIGAMLALGDNAKARALLRDWVWGPEANQRNLRLWQREITNSYLAEGNIRDAAIALEYYLRDYRGSLIGIELRQQALLLLLTNQNLKALSVLQEAKERKTSFLYLLASLRANTEKPEVILDSARAQSLAKNLNHSQKLRFLKVAFEAASISNPQAYQDLFLLLLASPVFNEVDQLFKIDAGAQWAYWFSQARKLGNKHQLLIGKDASWLALARRFEKTNNPHQARALYAFIAVHGLSKKFRDQAHQSLAANIEKLPNGERSLVNLYINAPLVIKYHNLGEKTRFKIADKAFILNLPEEASRLLADLPVRKEYALLKVLQQARILLLGGLHDRGANVLRKVLKQKRKLNAEELDRLMQVVFDLQNLNLHKEALEMFEIILANGPDEKVRRETLFWMANSLSHQQRYSEAAWHYLKSSQLLGTPNDLWGKTAQYYAAEVLIKGGFLDDAVRLFENLLANATESSRRSVLLNRIQQLHLRMSQPDQPPAP